MRRADYFVVFGKNGIGHAKLYLTGKSEHQHCSGKALRLE
jgi:hypothetical protein